jgi:hypothetical protein
MLKPELQGMDDYVDGIANIVETQKRIADYYFDDGSVEDAIPPLKALLHIMSHGQYEGKTAADTEVRDLFDPAKVREQTWYQQRLVAKQANDVNYLSQQFAYIEAFLVKETHSSEAKRLGLAKRLAEVQQQLETTKSSDYLKTLEGTLGRDCSL